MGADWRTDRPGGGLRRIQRGDGLRQRSRRNWRRIAITIPTSTFATTGSPWLWSRMTPAGLPHSTSTWPEPSTALPRESGNRLIRPGDSGFHPTGRSHKGNQRSRSGSILRSSATRLFSLVPFPVSRFLVSCGNEGIERSPLEQVDQVTGGREYPAWPSRRLRHGIGPFRNLPGGGRLASLRGAGRLRLSHRLG